VVTEPCSCEDGGEGRHRSRTFTCTWDIEISIDPGIAGVYEVEEFEIAVTSPCVCPDRTFEIADADLFDSVPDDDDHAADGDDDDAREGKKKKSGKKKAKGRGK